MRGFLTRKKIRRVRHSIPIANLVSSSFKKNAGENIVSQNELVNKVEAELGVFKPIPLNDGENVIAKPQIAVEDEGLYEGEWSTASGERHGVGTLVLKDGTKFVGSWRNG
jgi:hypothetical protein